MKVESIAEYFWPALSDKLSWKPIFGLFESGGFRLYCHKLSVITSHHFSLVDKWFYAAEGLWL